MLDVVILGAGPAGGTAARIISENGLDVLLLDRERFPRIKPCGGGLTSRALELLPTHSDALIKAWPVKWVFEGRGPQRLTRTVKTEAPYSHIVHRPAFDQWLVECAQAAGAQFHDNEAVTAIEPITGGYQVTTTRSTYRTRYLIGADGGRGISARLLGFSRPKNGAAVEVEIPVSDAVYAKWRESVLINTADYPWGYAWVIPRYPVLNIGVGSFHANRLRLQPLLHEWVAAKLGPDAGRDQAMLAHPLPYRYQPARLAKERALLVGDAAGLMDALSAEGIYSALYSASLAAQTVIAQSPHDASLEIYDHRLQRELWPGLKAAAKLALMFYPLPGMWSKIFLANPDLIEQYLKVAQGQAPYSSLLVQGQRTLLRRLRLSPSSLEGIGD